MAAKPTVLTGKSNPNKPLHPTQRRFLAAYGACGSIVQAARWAKIDRQNHYDWIRLFPHYVEAFANAERAALRTLEDEAVRRAHAGLRKAVRYKGRVVGYETEYSDQLLMFLMKAWGPDKYREQLGVKFDWDGNPERLTGQQRAKVMEYLEMIAFDNDPVQIEAARREALGLSAGEIVDVTVSNTPEPTPIEDPLEGLSRSTRSWADIEDPQERARLAAEWRERGPAMPVGMSREAKVKWLDAYWPLGPENGW